MSGVGYHRETDQRIRVLYVTDSFQIGGMEKQCYELAAHLDPKRFETGLVTLNASGPLQTQFEKLGCPIYEVSFAGGYWRPQSLRPLGRLVRIMRAFDADIVQAFGFYSNVPGILAARLAGIRGIIAGRRFSLPEDPALNHHIGPLKDRVDRLLWRFADSVVVNANAIRAQLVARGADPDKICVIRNGVDYEAVVKAVGADGGMEAEESVGMVAHFRPDKDHRTFLQAARYVLQHRNGVRFVLVGSGPLEASMRNYARDLGIAETVAFLGTCYGAELYRVLKRCAVMVLCSKGNEGLPNVLLEAMSVGKPVVATVVGGTPDVVQDGITGFLVDRGDAKALADRILFLLERPALVREMGAAGRARVQHCFTIERMAAQFAALYSRVLNMHETS